MRETARLPSGLWRCFTQKYLSLFLLVLGVLLPFGCSYAAEGNNSPVYPVYPKPQYGKGEHRKLVEHGEYLVKVGDCISCHTDSKNGGKPFAGGLGLNTPFGTFYTPNITADPETGIGKWSDADFIQAMQQGKMPDGSHYFPVFPYTSFHYINQADLLAIKAYLFSLPQVKQANRENDVMFPFSWRFLQFGWKLLFFHPGEYQYNAQQTAQWNRGAYLVLGLGHCTECHSPRNIFGGVKYDYAFTGGFVDGFYAPDITSVGLKGASIDDVVNVFLKGQMLRGAGQVQGPMAEVNYNSLRYLNHDDLVAIATYLKTVKSKEPETSSGKITSSTGEDIYESKCGVCHNSGGAGAPKLGDSAAWQPRIAQGLAVLDQHAINGFNSMPPKGTCVSCSDDEIKAVVAYMVAQSKPGASGNKITPAASDVPPLTMADGKRIYQQTCSVCHAEGKLGAPKVGDKAAWAPRIQQNMDVLFKHAIYGYGRMPAKGTCISCSNAEIQAAVKYMVQQSGNGDYSLW